MRKLILLAAAALAATCATAAFADPPPPAGTYLGGSPYNDPCSDVYVSGAIACVGYYQGNFFQGNAGDAPSANAQTAIAQLLNGPATDSESSYSPVYTLDADSILATIPHQTDGDNTFDFSPLTLSGLTIFGAHFGNNTDSSMNDVSAVWLIDFGNTSTSIVTLSDGRGVSNAQIFATGNTPGVPEPATWAMMLMGFGATGVAMRRRRGKAMLTQLA